MTAGATTAQTARPRRSADLWWVVAATLSCYGLAIRFELTELFCANSRMKIERLFEDLWTNNDAIKNKVAGQVLKYEHKWMEEGIIDIGVTNDAIRPKAIMDLRKKEAAEEPRLAAAS